MADQIQNEHTVQANANGRGHRPTGGSIELGENARTVLAKRYLRRGPDGKPAESIEEMFWRVAWNVAEPEDGHGADRQAVAEAFYDLLTSKRFFPNSPTFTGAGTPLGQLAACFVLPIDDDMGREQAGIFQTLRNAALIQQTGGGNGFAFSRLRPKGARVASSNGDATGPVGFLRVYDQAFGEIAQGGCLVPDTLVFTERGLLRLDEIVRHKEFGWRPHDLNTATDQGIRPSRQVYNNGVVPVLKVSTDAGLELTGTPNHKVKVMTAHGPEWRQLADLQSGDAVLVKLGQYHGQRQALRHPQQWHGNQIAPDLPNELDEEFAFFLGYLMGDGFVASGEHDHRVGVTVAHNSYLMEEVPALFGRLFGAHITVHQMQKPEDASATFVIDNRAIKDFLITNGLGKLRSAGAKVPRLIRQSPPEIVGAFLRGLFEADGGLSHGYPSLTSSSEILIREAATLLIGLGCPVRIHRLIYGENRYGDKPMWGLRVSSIQGLTAWRNRIGCDPHSRFAACFEHQPDLAHESSYALPNAAYWIHPVLESGILPQSDKRHRNRGRKFRSTSPQLRRKLLRYARGERQLTLSGYQLLAEEYSDFETHARPIDDVWFVTVTQVEAAGSSLTLDIEVDDNHTYLANGMVTHNSRRGANMAVLRVSHPDVRDFITCKINESHITNFNISVGVTDDFMRAVRDDQDFELINPQDGKVWETVRARDLFNQIVRQARHNGEPGMLFLDAANRDNPVPQLYTLESTNPCGEQFLGPFENCCLGSVNLAQHVTPDGKVDWDRLRESVELSTRFLDDVVDANTYVPAVAELKIAAQRVRRIGLGIMGLGDLMYALGVRYGSEEGQEFASQVMEFVHYHCMKTSVELAKERGAFLAYRGSLYDPDNLQWQPPAPLVEHKTDRGRPVVDWKLVLEGIKTHSIRNGAQTTIAPTGTISTVAGCEGYGCEPVFALAYIRHFNDAGKDVKLQYTSPLFEQALIEAGLSEEQRAKIVEQVNLTGSCQGVPDVPENIRHAFVVASDISAEEHVRMQAAMQRFVSNAISKTCNFPATATEDDVAKAYMLAWELGCKGLTVYVAGSREKVVLETHETVRSKEGSKIDMPKAEAAKPEAPRPAPAPAITPPAPAASPEPMPFIKNEVKKPRAKVLKGYTYRLETPLGTTFVTINENGGDQPFEVFMHTAKAGSDTAAVSEALGRLISYILRVNSPIEPRKRLREVVRQLEGIGGRRSLGLGPNRVESLPDGIAQVLEEYLHRDEIPTLSATAPIAAAVPPAENDAPAHPAPGQMSLLQVKGDLCPECGQAAVVNEEGCRKCYSCGYSEC